MFCNDFYRNKTVLVTGHTGFKGSWLCHWLIHLGAKVIGYSLEPPSTPSHYELTGLSSRLEKDIRNDICNENALKTAFKEAKPDVVFHCAAQPLVRLGFQKPLETFLTNSIGTFHVLDAIREMNHPCIAIMITTDKVYENREWLHSYRENDALGGYDPYSASKACAEIVISSYFKSFLQKNLFSQKQPQVAVASVRAGNVIGGGDWALDRIVPDCIRSLNKKEPILIRNKTATRPWQHVLEPLSGYLLLGATIAESLHTSSGTVSRLEDLCTSFNFGPNLPSNRTVLDLVLQILTYWPGEWRDASDPHAVHEASKLNLAYDRAFHVLHWQPQWDFEQTIQETVEWYTKAYARLNDQTYIRHLTLTQIEQYSSHLQK